MSGTTPGYGVHAGVEFRPTSNLSLSVGASFAQQPQDTGINSLVASPFAYGRH
jgi:opacity protein-like surface antigen